MSFSAMWLKCLGSPAHASGSLDQVTAARDKTHSTRSMLLCHSWLKYIVSAGQVDYNSNLRSSLLRCGTKPKLITMVFMHKAIVIYYTLEYSILTSGWSHSLNPDWLLDMVLDKYSSFCIKLPVCWSPGWDTLLLAVFIDMWIGLGVFWFGGS